MYHSIVSLSVLLTVALAGRSPHADLVDKLERSPEGSRYSSDVFEDGRLSLVSADEWTFPCDSLALSDAIDKLESSPEGPRYFSNVFDNGGIILEGVIRKYQYPYEEHQVTTEDGYILTAIRIPHGRDQNNQPGQKPVVLMMHGLLSSAADFVLLGPGTALGYMLAEEGYDVWVLNARGNFHSRNHTTLNPNRGGDPEFWAFSWHEIGTLDIPAYIDYILEYTGQEKVHYIGHSQGGTSFLVCMSMRPEYNEKIVSFQGLAPASFFYNNINPFYLFFATYERIIESLAAQIGIYEVLGRSDVLTPILMSFCADGTATQEICKLIIQYDQNGGVFNTTMFPAFLGHAPSGASIRQIAHYGQNIRFGTFSQYHFGHLNNLQRYGRVNPAPYNMGLVTARSYLHYSLADLEVNHRDVLVLEERLPNAEAIQVPRSGFNHFDFIWSTDARDQVFETVLKKMREAETFDAA